MDKMNKQMLDNNRFFENKREQSAINYQNDINRLNLQHQNNMYLQRQNHYNNMNDLDMMYQNKKNYYQNYNLNGYY